MPINTEFKGIYFLWRSLSMLGSMVTMVMIYPVFANLLVMDFTTYSTLPMCGWYLGATWIILIALE
jgi:hypothetical protein